ncbi:MAG TPA: hypothetical protein DEP47_15450 [Chloroflexi bacterium]|nr:hypothetical protein [Chloroflexota bacterium]
MVLKPQKPFSKCRKSCFYIQVTLRHLHRYSIVALLLSTLIWLTACERTLSGTERAAVLAFSEAITDNMFAGLAANDYAAFSRDFDSDMYERAPATEFSAWKEGLEDEFGAYLSRNVDKVTQSDEFYVVTYQATFEKEEQVTVTIAFHASDHSIALLSFESEKYAWSAWE